ncbi:uncharacterized protein LOC106659861 isoform X1 [Trichogramma pretiosum]|uniref:uncharacterized protein LOC106659861 isoform X1 n=1 Tax=Trichogramma pretiosum TaxID=7493 RepID=UPI0006C994DE|nr:uncharacterized protein LOC106659861 isoform X1 [Trichogramma pretiosum]
MSRCSIYGCLTIAIVLALIGHNNCAIDAQPIDTAINESQPRSYAAVASDLNTDATFWSRNYYGYRPFVGGRSAYVGYGPVYRTGAYYQPDVVFNVVGGSSGRGYRGYGGYPRFGGYGWAGYI